MQKIRNIDLPPSLPTDKAIRSWKQNIHDYEPVFWEFQYERYRYLKNISDSDLFNRHSDILRNLQVYSKNERDVIPINSFLSSWYWHRKEHQTRYEFFLRKISVNLPRFTRKKTTQPFRPKGPNSCDILFRYGESEYMRKFVEEGAIRISPAATYRNGVISGPRTDDELSKHKFLPGEYTKITTKDGKSIPIIGDVKSTVSIQEGYYTLCMATDFENLIFKVFKYDSCVIIKNPVEFSKRIQKSAIDQLPNWYFHHNPVEYFDPYEEPRNQFFNPAMCKDFRFAYQLEYRFIWDPLQKNHARDYIYLSLGSLKDISELHIFT